MLTSALTLITNFFQFATEGLGTISDHLYGGLLAWLLIAAGIWFTVRTRGLQFRLFGQMLRAIAGSRDDDGGISSFQAFTIGLASRVGTGNIVGVALAITLGGPGAVFWMWVVALVGMATGFIEATLAQLYKIRHPEGTFRGGPAYYISRGLGSKRWASVFAVVITFVFGFAYEATQANAISKVMEGTFGVPTWGTAVALVLLTMPVVFGGISIVARIAEWMAPLMAGLYALLAVAVLVLNADAIPAAMASIVQGAFGVDQAFAGIAGGFAAAALNGIKRGLFSNEAGEGSVPNAAATATVAHPVQQGFVQSLGVFVDTIVVCTATALIVLLSGVYTPEGARAQAAVDPQVAKDAASTLTSSSIGAVLGGWTEYLMAFIIAAGQLHLRPGQHGLPAGRGAQALRPASHDRGGHGDRGDGLVDLRVESVRRRHGPHGDHQHRVDRSAGQLGLRCPGRLGEPEAASGRRGDQRDPLRGRGQPPPAG